MRRMYSENQLKELVDSRVKALVEGGALENAKPIYWHSVTISRITSETLDYYLDFIIINNDPNPFTLTSFSEWLSNHQDAEIKIVQGYDRVRSGNLVSFFKYASTNVISINSVVLATGVIQTETYNISSGTLTDNGVNKLN